MSTSISATEIGLPDNAKLKLGTGEDLEIYHDGTNTYLDNNTGQFNIDSASGNAIRFLVDGSYQCQIYTSGIDLPDNKKLRLGDSEDLEIFHDGSDSNIVNAGTGHLYLYANSSDKGIVIKSNNDVELYYDNNLRLETTSGGVDISGSSDGVLNLDTTDGRGSFIRFKENGNSKCFVGCAEGLGLGDQDDLSLRATDKVFIQTGGSNETMRLGRSGSHAEVFINTTSILNGAVLSVATNGTNGIALRAGATNSQTHMSFQSPNGVHGTISTDGSNTQYYTSSDYRLKENVTAISDGITRIKNLLPKRFNFKLKPDVTQDGFLAHEVSSVVPEAVSGDKDAVDSNGDVVSQQIDQSKLVPLLVAAVQELAVKVEALEAA